MALRLQKNSNTNHPCVVTPSKLQGSAHTAWQPTPPSFKAHGSNLTSVVGSSSYHELLVCLIFRDTALTCSHQTPVTCSLCKSTDSHYILGHTQIGHTKIA
eukprot:3122780-Pleurochrysis_carterae.AAC.1